MFLFVCICVCVYLYWYVHLYWWQASLPLRAGWQKANCPNSHNSCPARAAAYCLPPGHFNPEKAIFFPKEKFGPLWREVTQLTGKADSQKSSKQKLSFRLNHFQAPGYRGLPQTSSTDTGATPCFDGNHPLMSSLLIARGQKWAFLNPNMINFSTPTILRFDHLLRFLHSSSNDHFPKHPPLPPPSLP